MAWRQHRDLTDRVPVRRAGRGCCVVGNRPLRAGFVIGVMPSTLLTLLEITSDDDSLCLIFLGRGGNR